MKMYKYLFVMMFFIILSCDSSITDGVNQENENIEPAIEFLRTTNDFKTEYLDLNDISEDYDNLNDLIESFNTSNENEVVEKVTSFFTSSYYKQRASNGSFSSISNVEQYIELPTNYVATAAGGRSTSKDFSVAHLRGALISSSGIDFNSTTIADSRNNQYALEALAFAPSNRIVIGIGLWVGRSDVRALSIYTAPYNSTTKEVTLVSEDVDLINESYVNVIIVKDGPAQGNAVIGTEEVRFRTFDYLTTLNDAKKTVITGFGAGVHNDNANRIGLELSTLPN